MSDGVVSALRAMVPELEVTHLARLSPSVDADGERAAVRGRLSAAAIVPISIDPRVMRMIRLAILSAPAVILVGPPGTGKTTLLRQVIDEIRADFGVFGFTEQVNEPIWSAPQENWTTTELVGGDTIESGELRFRPGLVLQAISENRWLVLDEANRADMDRIFGGLLTWLSGQNVNVGQAAPSMGAPSVELGWVGTAASISANRDQLEDPQPGGPTVSYLAGSEWRLLGTYNALDAQRVFRFGQAIGRRFLRVPIPAPTADEFRTALAATASDLASPLRSAIGALYEAHRSTVETELGPALFLRIPDYIRAGRDTAAEHISEENYLASSLVGDIPVPEGAPGGGSSSVLAPPGGGADGTAGSSDGAAADSFTIVDRELLAEAYLINVGAWLRQLDESLDALGDRIVEDHGCFSRAEWDWIVESSRVLG